MVSKYRISESVDPSYCSVVTGSDIPNESPMSLMQGLIKSGPVEYHVLYILCTA